MMFGVETVKGNSKKEKFTIFLLFQPQKLESDTC